MAQAELHSTYIPDQSHTPVQPCRSRLRDVANITVLAERQPQNRIQLGDRKTNAHSMSKALTIRTR